MEFFNSLKPQVHDPKTLAEFEKLHSELQDDQKALQRLAAHEISMRNKVANSHSKYTGALPK